MLVTSLFLKKMSKSKPSLLPALGTAKDGMTLCTCGQWWHLSTVSPGAGTSSSELFNPCFSIGMAMCQLLVVRSWVSGALLTAAEHRGRLMWPQICFSYPCHVNSRLQISAGVNQCYYPGSSCAELRTWQCVWRQEVGQGAPQLCSSGW